MNSKIVFLVVSTLVFLARGYSEPVWNLATPLGTAHSLCSAAFGNDIFVAVTSKSSETSTDGITWAEHPMPEGKWSSVAFGNGIFVAVSDKDGNSKSAAVSSDGVAWTLWNMSGDIKHENTYDAIVFGDGMFVALSKNDGFASRSADGAKWESSAFHGYSYIPDLYQPVCYGNGIFVCAYMDSILTSPDGLKWTRTKAPKGWWSSVAFGNGVFVAVAHQYSPSVITSPDGITWTPQPDLYRHFGRYTGFWSAIAFGDGVFAAVSVGKAAAYSSDGVTWTEIERPDVAQMSSIAFGNGIFVVVGKGPNAFSNSMASVIRIESQSTVAPTASSQAPQATKDPKERLKELRDLYDSGMITEQEYNDKKAEILSQM